MSSENDSAKVTNETVELISKVADLQLEKTVLEEKVCLTSFLFLIIKWCSRASHLWAGSKLERNEAVHRFDERTS